jgi:hypothetical protein
MILPLVIDGDINPGMRYHTEGAVLQDSFKGRRPISRLTSVAFLAIYNGYSLCMPSAHCDTDAHPARPLASSINQVQSCLLRRGERYLRGGFAARTLDALASDWECAYSGRFTDSSHFGPLRQGAACKAASGAALQRLKLYRMLAPDRPRR